jgi:hypothetical protein
LIKVNYHHRPSTASLIIRSLQSSFVIIAVMFQHRANEDEFLSASRNKDSRLILPGYGLPLDYAPVEKNIYGVESRSMFPSALDDRDIENGYTE